MTLQLDARQRAMLSEMGIRVFLPEQAAPAPEVQAVPAAVAVAAPVPAATVPPASAAQVRPPVAAPAAAGLLDVSAMDWDALEAAVRAWGAAQGRRTVWGTGDLRPQWLCVGDPPDEEEERQELPFAGERGQLLDNMLRAVGVLRSQGAYLANCWTTRLPDARAPTPAELAQQDAFLRRQVQLLQPSLILAMGRFAVQALLRSGEPPGRLRGRVHRFEGLPVVVTYPPVALLRTPADKAKAWADLCLARSVLAGAA